MPAVVDRIALDTSVAVPYLMRGHETHQFVRQRLDGMHTVLTAHSLAETYSVLTRLPGDARVAPADAVRLIDANMGATVPLPDGVTADVHRLLARSGIAGGAVYDALVGLAAREESLQLMTRDARQVEQVNYADVTGVVARHVAYGAAATGAVVGWVTTFAFADGDPSLASDSVMGPALLAHASVSALLQATNGLMTGLLLGYLQARVAVAIVRRRGPVRSSAVVGAAVVAITGVAITAMGFLGGATHAELASSQ